MSTNEIDTNIFVENDQTYLGDANVSLNKNVIKNPNEDANMSDEESVFTLNRTLIVGPSFCGKIHLLFNKKQNYYS